MGLDSNEKILADYNDVFADIMNVFLYDGERIIKEEDLENSKDMSHFMNRKEMFQSTITEMK